MANPVTVSLPADTWVNVASNTTQCRVRLKDAGDCRYFYTYKLTGGAAPTDLSDTQSVMSEHTWIFFSHNEAIDCYIQAKEHDSEALVMA